jgi:CO dehydrogenase maturation factor
MSITIAITGKGGVGKSTLAALMIRWLNEHGLRSILAVDADSNVNLNDLLGVAAHESIGALREEMKAKVTNLPGGMTKHQFLEYKIHQNIVETENFDLITMGRPEGPGCYCYANNLLRDIFKTVADHYQYVVIDNEAGMEHLSRRTTQDIDYMIVVSDPSVRGIRTAGRISRLLQEVKTRVKYHYLVINRVRSPLTAEVTEQIRQEQLSLIAVIPEDTTVMEHDGRGEAVYRIGKESVFYQAVDKFFSLLTDLTFSVS